jgi:molybdopterin molybdotransferase
MLTPHEAVTRILALMPLCGSETVPLRRAAGRVLAEPLRAGRDQPPFAASAMDGYAIRAEDALPGRRLAVIGMAQAGRRFPGRVGPGQSVRIFTGAPVPQGAERIILQEDATRDGDVVIVGPDLTPDIHVRPQGYDFPAGHEVSAPRRLTPADLALLAAMNIGRVPVRRRPDVAILATGDELVMPGETPSADQIISSNGFALAALLEAQGATARLLPIARDTADSLGAALSLARDADLIVTLGGASVGEHDLVREVSAAQGMQLDFWKVAIRPGKPLIAGRLGNVPLVGLPGNPVSAFVCGHLFLRPAVDAMLGLPAGPLARLEGRLTRPLPANSNREHYLRGRASLEGGTWLLEPFDRQDSAQLSLLARSNALIVAPPGQPALPAGESAAFIPIGQV